MRSTYDRFDTLDARIAGTMRRYGVPLLRVSLGVVFLWFGALKLFPGLSPAEPLVARTVYWFDPAVFVPILGAWEMVIGVGLIVGRALRVILGLLFLQMPGTFLPLVLVPEACYALWPVENPLELLVLTTEGQYIIKNLVLISAALVVGGQVRQPRAEGGAGAEGAGPNGAGRQATV